RDNNDGSYTYFNESGDSVTFNTLDTNSTSFGQIGDSVYYVDGFGDTSKVYVDNDTVITTLTANGNGVFTYLNEAGTSVSFDIKDTNSTSFGQIGDSLYYVDGFGDTSKVYVDNITSVDHPRNDTLSIIQGNNTIKVDLANTMAEIYDSVGGNAIGNSFTDISFGISGIVDANYTAAASTITVLKSGRYRISYRVTAEMVSGNNRSATEYRLVLNSVNVPGTKSSAVHRNDNISESTVTVTKVLQLSAGDIIKVQGRRYEGESSIETTKNGSSLLIEKL
ncbi:MAG: hypothetical protein ABF272_04900, partial [Flavobacteriales bacterium]